MAKKIIKDLSFFTNDDVELQIKSVNSKSDDYSSFALNEIKRAFESNDIMTNQCKINQYVKKYWDKNGNNFIVDVFANYLKYSSNNIFALIYQIGLRNQSPLALTKSEAKIFGLFLSDNASKENGLYISYPNEKKRRYYTVNADGSKHIVYPPESKEAFAKRQIFFENVKQKKILWEIDESKKNEPYFEFYANHYPLNYYLPIVCKDELDKLNRNEANMTEEEYNEKLMQIKDYSAKYKKIVYKTKFNLDKDLKQSAYFSDKFDNDELKAFNDFLNGTKKVYQKLSKVKDKELLNNPNSNSIDYMKALIKENFTKYKVGDNWRSLGKEETNLCVDIICSKFGFRANEQFRFTEMDEKFFNASKKMLQVANVISNAIESETKILSRNANFEADKQVLNSADYYFNTNLEKINYNNFKAKENQENTVKNNEMERG